MLCLVEENGVKSRPTLTLIYFLNYMLLLAF